MALDPHHTPDDSAAHAAVPRGSPPVTAHVQAGFRWLKSSCRVLAAGILVGCLGSARPATAAEPSATETNRPPPFARGTINKLDQYHKVLTVLSKDGEEKEFYWTPKTIIYLGPKRLTPDKLQPGDEIAIRHQVNQDGNLSIVRMKVYREGVPRTALEQTEP